MLHVYRLVYPFSQHAPPQLWEYEQPYIANLILNARTFDQHVVQWYFEDGQRSIRIIPAFGTHTTDRSRYLIISSPGRSGCLSIAS
jgi:hypothetical protein